MHDEEEDGEVRRASASRQRVHVVAQDDRDAVESMRVGITCWCVWQVRNIREKECVMMVDVTVKRKRRRR